MVHILYNTISGAHYSAEDIKEKLSNFFPNEEFKLADVVELEDKQSYVNRLLDADKLVVVGGDGTLNRFVNSVEDKEYPFPIYCYAGGTGNDFVNDVVGLNNDAPVMINDYITKLPVISVKGKEYKFINGIGFGIDGWCCEVGDAYREKHNKAPNYTKIALSGLLKKFKPVHAKITVDGELLEYDNCWMAPTMNGRYFGGGMMISPMQDRLNEERNLTVVAVTAKSRLRLLTIFPKIFKGGHTGYSDVFKAFTGKDVKVEFDRPVALQIDGETVLDVTEYSVKSYAVIKETVTK